VELENHQSGLMYLVSRHATLADIEIVGHTGRIGQKHDPGSLEKTRHGRWHGSNSCGDTGDHDRVHALAPGGQSPDRCPKKALYGCFLVMTSPARGAIAGWISAPGEPSARMAPLAIFGDEMANSPRSLPSCRWT
jgi:hypothetical protein